MINTKSEDPRGHMVHEQETRDRLHPMMMPPIQPYEPRPTEVV